jgi:glycosyltransferase involved in cell wall biosynthesis
VKLSVIVTCDPVHDNSGEELLSAYLNQSLPHPQFEVVIVDNCDRVHIEREALRFNATHPKFNLRYVKTVAPRRAAALNVGIRMTQGSIVAILADDAVPCSGALQSLLDFHHGNPHPLAVAIGPMLFREPLRHDPLRRWLEDSGTQFGVSMRTTYSAWPQQFFYAGNCAMKRELFAHVGLFDERFPWITWDDYEFGTRLVAAGGYSQLVVGALAWHEHYVSLPERAGSMRRGGHAAVIHESIGAQTRSWEPMLERAHRIRHQELAPDDPNSPLWKRIPRFMQRFDREFLLGYESERRGDRSDLPGLLAST